MLHHFIHLLPERARLRSLIKNANRKPQPWYRAEVVQVTPKLIFAIADKEFKFDSSTGLIMTATARAKEWKVGMQAAALLHGAQLLVLDSL